MITNLPNIITWLRILLSIIFIIVFQFLNKISEFLYHDYILTLIFIISALTDLLDGYLARKFKKISLFGKFLDPVADKFMIISVIIILIYLKRINLLISFIIISREIVVLSLREWTAKNNCSKILNVNNLGKLKTGCQMIAFSMLLFNKSVLFFWIIIDFSFLGKILIYTSTILTILSMFHYIVKFLLKNLYKRNIFKI